MDTYEGGCHCGRVRFRVKGALDGVTDCNCSICSKKGFLHWIVPLGSFELLAGAGELTTYTFNTGVAQHRFCRHCGIHAFYVPRSDPDKIDVNVRCLEGVDPRRVPVSPFDGQNWEASTQGPVPWRAHTPALALVVTLVVRREAEESFRAYEHAAAAIMRRHGGAIERTVAVASTDPALFEEIHLVTFPDAAAFSAYQHDPALMALAPQRAAAVAETRVVLGEEGPRYG
jgi:uncharacterized protein (DUF1330 family)